MLKVGITGGIGTGKSTVCRIFETLGIPVFNADTESKNILHDDSSVQQEVKKILGEGVFYNSVPDTKKIADVVFNNPEKLQELNSILHPATFKYFGEWVSRKKGSHYVIMEAALIYETGADKFLDKMMVVSAPLKLCIERTINRSGLSEEEVKARMKYQFPNLVIESRADFLIMNDEEQLIIPQVMDIHQKLLEIKNAD